jgi:predicted nucleotidyltransferase
VTDVPDFRAVLQRLTDNGVRFVLIGGLAMVAHGSAHITRDIDVGYARDLQNLAALVQALEPLRPRLRDFPPELPFVWDIATIRASANQTFETSVGDVDLLGDIPGIDSFEGLWNRAVDTELFGIPIKVASIDDLVAMKQAADRTKDRLHLLELQALKKLSQDAGSND